MNKTSRKKSVREEKLESYTTEKLSAKELLRNIERLEPSRLYQALILEKKLKSTVN